MTGLTHHHHHLLYLKRTLVVFQGSRINSALLEPFFFFQILVYVVIQAEAIAKYMHSFLLLGTIPITFFACGAFLAPICFLFLRLFFGRTPYHSCGESTITCTFPHIMHDMNIMLIIHYT